MKKNSLLLTAGLVVAYGLCAASVQALQLPNLTNENPAARFTVIDRVWPTSAGDADICIWADDKLAAISFTVDDNCYGNVAWWMQAAEKYGFKVTWFLITDRIGKGDNAHFNGTWEQWRQVKDLGHDLQSHTAWHLHTELPECTNIDDEYRNSQVQIEANLPGHKCDFIAYPGGAKKTLNNRTNAASYYAAARGGAGSGINAPNKIDYLAIKNMSGFSLTNSAAPWANLPSLLDSTDTRYYRGWAVLLWHYIKDYKTVTPLLDFVDANRADFWICTFGEGAKYGQERDTATLKVNVNTADRIELTLTDLMLDSRFDYPLTIKVRLPSEWNNVKVEQNGQSIAARVIEYDHVRYMLVNAVPDCGQIILEPTSL